MATAEASSDAFSVPSTDSATLAPTPCTVCSRRNHSRSMSLAKPNSLIWSSRTWVSIDSVAGFARRRQRLQRARRAMHLIADAADVEDDVVLAVAVDDALELADHVSSAVLTPEPRINAPRWCDDARGRPRSPARRRHPRSCGSAFGSSTPIIMRICAFSPWPAPTTVFFTTLGAYSATVKPGLAPAPAWRCRAPGRA